MATSSVPKGKYLNEEYLAICAELDTDEWVDISTLTPIIAGIRIEHNVQETKEGVDNFEELILKDQIKYFKENHLKQMQKALREAKKAGLIDDRKKSIKLNGDKVKGYKGLQDDYMLRPKKERISKEGIEIVRGSLNFSILSQIQEWVTDRIDQKEKVPPYFISIEDSLYGTYNNDGKSLTLEQKHLSRLSYSIIYKKAVKITYLPNALGGKQPDELTFSPEYLRRVGRKWMVYGMSKSKQFPQPAYVNLVLGRIEKVTESNAPYTPSGVDYTDDPFKDQITYHGFSVCSGKLEKVVLKVRKEKPGYTSGTKIYPFVRIQQEPLHYSQTVIRREDKDYGYISIEITDAMFIRPILLTWGADIEVIEPAALREQMRQEIATMQVMYAPKASQ